MNKNIAGIASQLLVVVATANVVGADESFLFRKEVAPATKAEESLLSVALDSEVYAATQDGLADLRLLNADGTIVPFLVRKSQDVKSQSVHRSTWTASKPTLRPLDDGGLEITVSLDKDDPEPQGLRLISPLKNFEQQVRIQTSADGTTWEPAGQEAVIFDYSRYMDVRNDQVAFPETTRKHVRVIIDDVTAEQQSELMQLTRHLRGNKETDRVESVTIDRRPFRIDRIEFWREVPQEGTTDRKQTYPVAGFSSKDDAKTHLTIVTIDTHREPLTQMIVESSSRNFSRHCVVEIPEQQGVQTTWRQIGSATLTRMDFKTLQREALAIEFPETRNGKYRLVIDNRDSEPLSITGIKAEGNVYELDFLSATDKSHRLMYGNAQAKAPQYDTAAIDALLTANQHPEVVTLGSEQKVTGAVPSGIQWSSALNDPRVLTGIIGLLVLVLGWGLYGAVKRMDSSLPPEPPPT